MYLEHASYRYPTHLVPLLDLALTLLLLTLLVWTCRRGLALSWPDRVWRAARRWSSSRGRLLLGLFAGGILAAAAVEAVLGPPVPRVVDELSYLFAAETFARGDLTNPVPAHWRHFDAVHVLPEPTVQSKYPPAQGMVLALGVLAGRPSATLWLMTGLLTAATAWLLSLRLPAPWPLFGSLAVLFRVGLGSYWNQSYWGGTVAAIGGILTLGGAWAFRRRPEAGSAALLGLGLVVLAASRPFEGLLFALPVAWFVGVPLLRGTLRRSAAGSLLAVLAAGAAALGGYNAAVTGDPLLLPHVAYSESVGIGEPHFLWQVENGSAQALGLGLERTTFVLFFFLGLGGSLTAALAWPDLRADPELRLAALSVTATLAGAFLTRPFYVHYAAPLAGAVLLLATLGLRRLVLMVEVDGRAGRLLVLAFVLAQLALGLAQLPAHRVDPDSVAGLREATRAWLLAEPGRDLVFLCREPLRDEWMVNPPDLEHAEILWARELDASENEALRRDVADRRIWHLELGQEGVVLRRGDHDGDVVFTAP